MERQTRGVQEAHHASHLTFGVRVQPMNNSVELFLRTTGFVSIYFFRWSVHRAREKGLLDMTTQY